MGLKFVDADPEERDTLAEVGPGDAGSCLMDVRLAKGSTKLEPLWSRGKSPKCPRC